MTRERTAPVRPEGASNTATEVVDLLFGAVGALRDHVANLAADVELSPNAAKALIKLGEPAPMRELAERMACDPSNVTGIVDLLERRGLVTRQPSPTDRRVKQLVLTEAGQRLRQVLRRRMGEAPGVGDLTGDEQRTLRDLLVRISKPQR